MEGSILASSEIYRIGAIIPLSGVAGLYGPSCKACLLLAQDEINAKGGIGGHHVEILFIDGDRPAAEIGRDISSLLNTRAVHALIGMHNSDVRNTVATINAGRVIYIYTATFEGGHHEKGLVCIGETPAQQIRPAINWFRQTKNVKNWCFIGSDYSWPRKLLFYLGSIAGAEEIQISESYFVDCGESEFAEYLDEIERAECDAVFFALVGAEAVNFNRQFGERKYLSEKPRFGPLLEENTLLAIGEENAQNIFSASAYFPSVKTDQNTLFKQKYVLHAGALAPEINMLSVSSYAGLHLLAEILPSERLYDATAIISQIENRRFDQIIGEISFSNGRARREVFIAEAVNNSLEIVHSFGELVAD